MKYIYQVLFDNTKSTTDYYDSAMVIANNEVQVVGLVMEANIEEDIESITKIGTATQKGVLNGVIAISFNAG